MKTFIAKDQESIVHKASALMDNVCGFSDSSIFSNLKREEEHGDEAVLRHSRSAEP